MVRYAPSIVAGIGGILIASTFLVRTDLVAGSIVATKVSELANQRDIELEIGGMNPTGFTGIQFVDVSVSAPLGSQRIDAHFDRVHIFPTFSFPPSIREIELIGGVATSSKALRRPKPVREKSDSVKRNVAKSSPKTKQEPPEFRLVFSDVDFEIPGALGPVKLGHAHAQMKGRQVRDLTGYGLLPSGEGFAIESNGEEIKVESSAAISINDNLKNALPVDVSVESLTFCRTCTSVAALHGVSVKLGRGSMAIPSVELAPEGEAYRVVLDEVAYDRVPARIVDWNALVSTSGATNGTMRVAGAESGSLEFKWEIDPEVGEQKLRLNAQEFPVREWEEMNPFRDIFTSETVNGVATFDRNVSTEVISTHIALRARNAFLHLDRISKDPVTLPRVGLDLRAIWDRAGKSWSIYDGQLHLDASDPIDFRGRLVGAEQGATFFARVDAPRLNAVVVRDAMPKSMIKVVQNANIDGDFSFWFEVGGHTAFPDGLHLDGGIGGGVQVLDDNPAANVNELLTAGKPSLDSIPSEQWTSLASLPAIVPTTLLAAEDAQFYKHDGFDWTGFKRAMIHNLKRGKLERGASTLTQQVVKNLYLGGERTISRKIQEMYLTWRIETEVEKNRILEIYLNIANWGPGVFGITDASSHYFSVQPDGLSTTELALLMAILPNPKIFGGSVKLGKFPANRVEKFEHILNNLRFLNHITYEQYRTWMHEASNGIVGRLKLTPCDDGTKSPWVIAAPRCEDI